MEAAAEGLRPDFLLEVPVLLGWKVALEETIIHYAFDLFQIGNIMALTHSMALFLLGSVDTTKRGQQRQSLFWRKVLHLASM